VGSCTHDWTVLGAWTGPDVPGCTAPLLLACKACGEARGIRCGTSRASKCEGCALVYRGRVGKVAGSGLVTGVRGLFLTLTAPGAVEHRLPSGRVCPCTPVEGTDLAEWNAGASARWNRFLRDLSRLMKADLVVVGEDGREHVRQGVSYFRATEVQRRGALHYHVLLRRVDGRPVTLARADVRRLAIRHRFGHSVDVQRLEPGHAVYVAKYVAKSADGRQDVPWKGERWKPVPGYRVSKRWGLLFNDAGEIVGQTSRQMVTTPTYRTWSASRTWGTGMAAVKAAQAHYVQVLAALPCWSETGAPAFWRCLEVPAMPGGVPPD